MPNPKIIELSEPLPANVLPEDAAAPKKKHIGARIYFTTFATNIFITFSTIFPGIIIARILGPTGRGEIAAIMLWPSIFAGLGLFGVDTVFGLRAAKCTNIKNEVKIIILIVSLLSVFTVILSYLLLPYMLSSKSSSVAGLSKLFVLVIPAIQLRNICLLRLQGMATFKKFNITRAIISPCVVIALCLFMLVRKMSIDTVIYSYIFGEYISASLAFIWNIKIVNNNRYLGSHDVYEICKIFRKGLSFFLAQIIDIVYQRVDQILIIILLPSNLIGLYCVAFSAAGLVRSVANSAGLIGFSLSASENRQFSYVTTTRIFRQLLILCTFIGFLWVLVLPWPIKLIYGKVFIESGSMARILVLGITTTSLANYLDQSMRGQGKPMIGASGRVIMLLSFISIGYILSVHYSGIGICISYVISQFLYLIWMIIKTKTFYVNASLTDYLPSCDDLIKVWQLLIKMFLKFRVNNEYK